MTCSSCIAFDAAERAAIEGREMPAHALDGHTCEDDAFDVLYLSPAQFGRSPQVGTPCRMTWHELALYLSRSTVGDPERFPNADEAKKQCGAWSPCLYQGNHRCKKAVVRGWAITFDIDGGGDVKRAAAAFAAFKKIIHSTYKSTPEAPRCRVVLPLVEPCTSPKAHAAAHKVVREQLAARGFICDDGASDISRLNFAPMVYPGREFQFLATGGAPFNVERFLASRRPPDPPKPPPAPEHRDTYARGALQRAAAYISSATVGDRHHAIGKEAYSLARPDLGLTLDEVKRALLPAFVAVAGEARRYEGERTIADAFAAGRKGES